MHSSMPRAVSPNTSSPPPTHYAMQHSPSASCKEPFLKLRSSIHREWTSHSSIQILQSAVARKSFLQLDIAGNRPTLESRKVSHAQIKPSNLAVLCWAKDLIEIPPPITVVGQQSQFTHAAKNTYRNLLPKGG